MGKALGTLGYLPLEAGLVEPNPSFDVFGLTREAKLLKTFDHPAVPRFFDYAPEAEPPYIAMAHAPGRPASRLCSPPRLRPSEVAAVGANLAQVLAVVHARGVLHRDINANNVLIDEHGAVTLLDFASCGSNSRPRKVSRASRRSTSSVTTPRAAPAACSSRSSSPHPIALGPSSRSTSPVGAPRRSPEGICPVAGQFLPSLSV